MTEKTRYNNSRGTSCAGREIVSVSDLASVILRDRLIVIMRGIPDEKLLQAALACAEGGITLLETTFDHTLPDYIADNQRKIALLSKTFGGKLHIGAGTVLTPDEADAAAEAGAEFIVSPDTNEAVIAETKRLGLGSVPGAMTPGEIAQAWRFGADCVKLFPADELGYRFIRSLQGPLGHIPLMATGNVNAESIPEYLQAGVRAFGVGSSILRKDLLAADDYESIRNLARKHADAARGVFPK